MGRTFLKLDVELVLAVLAVLALLALRIAVGLRGRAAAVPPPPAQRVQAAVAASTAPLTMTLKQADLDRLRRVMDVMSPSPEELERREKERRAVEDFERRFPQAPQPPARAPEPPAQAADAGPLP